MARRLVLFLGLVAAAVVLLAATPAAGVNITIFRPRAPPTQTRAAAAAEGEAVWTASLGCALPYTGVAALDAAGPARLVGCTLQRAVQGSRVTTLLLACPPPARLTNVDDSAAPAPVTAAKLEAALRLVLKPPAVASAAACFGAPLFAVRPDAAVQHTGAAADMFVVQSGAPWGLDRINQAGLALDGVFSATRRGTGCVIYHLDTGVLVAHPDFEGRASILLDLVVPPAYAQGGDCEGHGTLTSSLAMGATFGVAKAALLRAYRVLDCDGTGMLSDVWAALSDIMDQQAAPGAPALAVLTLSLSGSYDATLNRYIDMLVQNYRVVVVAAAGNNGRDASAYSPGSAAQALAVAATDAADQMPAWSNRGSVVRLAAPGVSVWGATIGGQGDAIAAMDGTSASTPLVAGAAALLIDELLANVTGATGLPPSTAQVRDLLVARAVARVRGPPNAAGLPVLFVTPHVVALPPPPPASGVVPPASTSSTSAPTTTGSSSNSTTTGTGGLPPATSTTTGTGGLPPTPTPRALGGTPTHRSGAADETSALAPVLVVLVGLSVPLSLWLLP